MQSPSRFESSLDQDIDNLIRHAQESQPDLTEEEKEGFESDETDEDDDDTEDELDEEDDENGDDDE